MTCKQCKYITACMAESDCLGQVFDPNYDGEHGCTDFVPFTNADRIRTMSDEELAVWMTSIRLDTINEMCKKFDVEIEMPVPTVENTADVCEWLKQPAE